MIHYQHLSHEERFYIHQAVREGKRNVEIAHALGRHPATISREKCAQVIGVWLCYDDYIVRRIGAGA